MDATNLTQDGLTTEQLDALLAQSAGPLLADGGPVGCSILGSSERGAE